MAIDDHPVIAVIPARLASTRFPRKALASETGKPLIQHVYEAAQRASLIDDVLVATDSDEISAAVDAFGGRAVLTDARHPNGATRIAEAAETLSLPDDAFIVNVQGDEPEIDPAVIDEAVRAINTSDAPAATVASPFAEGERPDDPNIVKVVLNRRSEALYFSRSLIPHNCDRAGGQAPLKHIGLYVYRRAFLRTYIELPETPLETTEKLEQLRILEHGHSIAVAVCACRHHGIDTPEQYAAFVARQRAAPRG